jgi:putative addiction module component (TIGR02574 family)
MSPELDELLKKAMSLPPQDRGALAATLLESLDEVAQADPDVEAEWQNEIARRLDEIRAGKVKTVPWPEVRRKARRLLNSK